MTRRLLFTTTLGLSGSTMRTGRFIRGGWLAGALSLAATALPAQNAFLKFRSGPPTPLVTQTGFYLGPFSGTLSSDPTQPEVDYFLASVLHRIRWDETWVANLGGAPSASHTKRTVYLATTYQLVGVPWQHWWSIQNALWYGFPATNGSSNGGSSGPADHGNGPNIPDQSQGKDKEKDKDKNDNAGNSASGGGGPGDGGDDEDDGTPSYPGGSTEEEAMTTAVTPEPESWVLMGTGLVLILGVAVRRGSLL